MTLADGEPTRSLSLLAALTSRQVRLSVSNVASEGDTSGATP